MIQQTMKFQLPYTVDAHGTALPPNSVLVEQREILWYLRTSALINQFSLLLVVKCSCNILTNFSPDLVHVSFENIFGLIGISRLSTDENDPYL